MVKNINHDMVAAILGRLQDTESDESELPLEYSCDAREYYSTLSEVVDTLSCVVSVFKQLPAHVVSAADMSIKIDYSDNVVGKVTMTGGYAGEETN